MVKILKEANETIPSEILEFSQKINFDTLSSLISKHLKTDFIVKLFPGKIEEGRKGYDIPVESKDIKDKCGIMSEVFDSVIITFLVSNINTDNNGSLSYRCSPCFKHVLKEGGFNYFGICDAIFTEENGWEIR